MQGIDLEMRDAKARLLSALLAKFYSVKHGYEDTRFPLTFGDKGSVIEPDFVVYKHDGFCVLYFVKGSWCRGKSSVDAFKRYAERDASWNRTKVEILFTDNLLRGQINI